MSRYATGNFALGICDVCGQACDYRDMQSQVRFGRFTGLRICTDCVDVDHPRPPKVEPDAQALRYPRPDPSLDASRRILHWKPTDSAAFALSLGEFSID